jgi:energy-coupling factor transporter ATP-binding protein EcfA2
MTVYDVRSVNVKSGRKVLLLHNKSNVASSLPLHRFAMVGPGDRIRLIGSSSDVKVSLVTDSRGIGIPIAPHFQCHYEVRFGEERLNVVITEISSDSDFEDYRRLEQFHYKGINLQRSPDEIGNLPVKSVGGRRALLLASIQKNGMSRAVGYIEIQMPLMMCKPRHVLFSRPFHHKASGVAWETWLGDGQQFVNSIARIARVVVDPEFRGIGISPLLVEATKLFCRERWHIGGVKPLFIEISAEMLRYVDFVSRAGLHYVGDTEGNLDRINKDLHSIEKGAAGKSGIMSLQKKYHTAFLTYCKKTGRSFHEARLVLSELLQSEDPRSEMASDEWLAFRPILRFPIPYFVAGLDSAADKYVTDGLKEMGSPPDGDSNEGERQGALNGPRRGRVLKDQGSAEDMFEAKGIEVWLDYKIPLTPYVRLVMDSFGIETQRIQAKLLGPVDVVTTYGNIVLLTGASGAGKSVLLQALSDDQMAKGLIRSIQSKRSSGNTRMLSPLPDGVPIFQYFADMYGPDKAFSALCQVGLSEAMVFVKPFEVLSMGQRYRAMFADLILSEAKIWLIDEFCSNLDPITSKIISARLRKLAQRSKRFVIVAAANTEHFIKALSPDRVLVVRIGGEIKQMRMTEYMNGFYNKGF